MTDNLTRVVKEVELRLERLFKDGCSTPNTGIFSSPIHSALLTQVHDLTMRGGKRLRAQLTSCGAILFGGSGFSAATIDAAAALEILQTYFLIHDDIMDEDEIRRGGPSVHVALANEYEDQKLGINLAVLAGDMATSLQEGLIADLDTSENRRRAAAKIFAEMHLEVIHGQTLDMLGGADPEEIAARKTAGYTTIGPLTIGAVLAGASTEDLLNLAQLARPLGIAFQFRDDMLSLFGDSAQTGKPVATDIKEGKQTFLISETMRLGSDSHKSAVSAALGNKQADASTLDEAINAIVKSGAQHSCQQKIISLQRDALRMLNNADYTSEGKRLLQKLAQLMIERHK